MTDKIGAVTQTFVDGLRDAGWLVVEPGKHTLVHEFAHQSYAISPKAGYYLERVYMVPEETLERQPTETPDTIDWSHVDPKYRYMARDGQGNAALFTKRPERVDLLWCFGGGVAAANCFASYRRGTVPWDKSLVCREDEE